MALSGFCLFDYIHMLFVLHHFLPQPTERMVYSQQSSAIEVEKEKTN